MINRRNFLQTGSAGILTASTTGYSLAQGAMPTTRIRMTMIVSPKEPLGVGMEYIVREAEKRSGGAVKIDFFPSEACMLIVPADNCSKARLRTIVCWNN